MKYGRGDGSHPFDKHSLSLTGAGIFSRLLIGDRRTDRGSKAGVGQILKKKPIWTEFDPPKQVGTVNFYCWHYCTNAIHQIGGKSWRTWREEISNVLSSNQRRKKGSNLEVAGSWDPVSEWGLPCGRVYSTAMAVLTLEVFYRLPRTKSKGL